MSFFYKRLPSTGGVGFPLEAPDGTNAAPSYSFTNDTVTGMYLQGIGTISLCVNSTDLVTINSTVIDINTSLNINEDGTENLPSLYIGNTTPCGIFSVANANALGISCNDNEIARFDTAGLKIIEDKKLILDTAGDAWLKYSPVHGNIHGNSNSSNQLEFSSIGEMYLWSHSAADGSGSWEPNIGLFDAGWIGFENVAQGNAADRYVDIHMDQGVTNVGFNSTLRFRKDGQYYLQLGYDSNGSARTSSRIKTDSKPLILEVSQVEVPNGSVTAPSYSFMNKNDSGLFLPNTSYMALSWEGAEAFWVDGSGCGPYEQFFASGGGNASNPDITWSGNDGFTQDNFPSSSLCAIWNNQIIFGFNQYGLKVASSDGTHGLTFDQAVMFSDNSTTLTTSIGNIEQLTIDANSGVIFGPRSTPYAKVGQSAVATKTNFWLYDGDNGTMVQVEVGADDSGGTGYKVLRIPN